MSATRAAYILTLMGVYDQSARYACHADPHAVVRRLLRDSGAALRFASWEDSRPTPLPGGQDRTADRIAVLTDEAAPERPWLLVLEFQSRPDPDKLDVTLVEASQLRQSARHGEGRREKYPVIVGLVYLQDADADEPLDMTLPNGRGTFHSPLYWNVREDSASVALEDLATGRTTWGVLFFVPLMKGGDEPGVIERWKELCGLVPETQSREELGGVALIFAELAGRYLAWEKSLKEWNMTESMVVNEWMRQAAERAHLESGRKFLTKLLNRRFPGEVTKELSETIDQQPSESLLEEWYDRANEVATMDEFMKVVRR